MTREEAIYCLKSYQPDAPDDMCQKCKYYKSVKLAPNIYTCISSKARDMAIQALSQEFSRDIKEIAEIMKCDADAETKLKMISNILSTKSHYFELSKEPKKWTIYTNPNETKYFECSKEVFKEIIKNDINKHKQKPCDKCAMKNSNSNYCENCTVTEYHGEKVSIPTKFVKQEPCDDAISRQAAIDAFERFIHELGIEDEPYNYGEMALSVKNVPPITQKSGEWIKREYWKPLPYDTEPLDYDNYDEKTHSEKVYHYYCSECDRDEGETKPTDNFCPNCGAKMEREDKEK